MSTVASTGALGLTPLPAHAAGPRPLFQLPFPCGEQWSATTYYGHNPIEKIDFFPVTGKTEGRPVLADADGVAYSGGSPDSRGGYQVAIDHGNGWATLYLHLQAGSFRVPNNGQRVHQGEQVARVGNTGTDTSAPHLHYEQVRDAYVNSSGELVYGTIVRAMFDGKLATYTPEHPQTLTSHNCDDGNSSVSGDGRTVVTASRPSGQVIA
ncbi:M23 family metallopeptidase [Planosporangium thailandense]|uniref:M23 family metallopeptidase n=1 Tax=Planosporangium thailandense TaxID=765197 RepID=A0ABX0XSF5_9ACTN|nr:M23 family metallopeptidase [Planosporangium thailandense]